MSMNMIFIIAGIIIVVAVVSIVWITDGRKERRIEKELERKRLGIPEEIK